MSISIIRYEGEERVNTHTVSSQNSPRITTLDDGGWVVTWVSDGQDGSGLGIYQQRYGADGQVRGSEQLVNTTTSGQQDQPHVAALDDGGWLVTWASDNGDGSGYNIYQQRYGADGAPDGAEQQVNTYATDDQSFPSAIGLPDGGWVVTWTSAGQDGSGDGIYQRRYNADGSIHGGEGRVNTHTSLSQNRSSVTVLSDGSWVVTWVSEDQDGSGFGIYQQHFNPDGSASGTEQRVNSYTSLSQDLPSVTALHYGGWVVTWQSQDQDGSGSGVYQQRFTSDGSAYGAEQRVNTTTTDFQGFSHVTGLADGGWIVTWTSNLQDGSGYGIYQQRYSLDGSPRGAEQQVNLYTTGNQDKPNITSLPDGGWVVTWQSQDQDGSGNGIYQQRFSFVTEFGLGKEIGTGTADDDLIQIRNGGLGKGDRLDAGGGIDTVKMVEAGVLDLTAPDQFSGVEIIRGSGGNDVIVAGMDRLAGIIGIQGGAGFDELRLKEGSYYLPDTFISGFESVTISGGTTIWLSDKTTALLVHSLTKSGRIFVESETFSLAERQQLYRQGITQVVDAAGTHYLQPSVPGLNQTHVQENAASGTVVGNVWAGDPNPGDGLRIDLVDNAGGRFLLNDKNQLVVAPGVSLDHEQAASYQIVIRVTDLGGLAFDQAFTITIDDIPVEKIRGTSRADVLTGGTSKDVLYGGLGKDKLTGGAGQDAFVFDTKPSKTKNLDTITDFTVKDDSIWLDNAIFKALGKKGTEDNPVLLKSSAFYAGSSAHDGNDRIIYNKKTGALFYDADGTGSAKQVQIATLSKSLKLTFKDFFVI